GMGGQSDRREHPQVHRRHRGEVVELIPPVVDPQEEQGEGDDHGQDHPPQADDPAEVAPEDFAVGAPLEAVTRIPPGAEESPGTDTWNKGPSKSRSLRRASRDPVACPNPWSASAATSAASSSEGPRTM